MEAEIARLDAARSTTCCCSLNPTATTSFAPDPRAARRARHRALGRPQPDCRARLHDRSAGTGDGAGRPRPAGAGAAESRPQRDRTNAGAARSCARRRHPSRPGGAHHRQRRRRRDPTGAAQTRVFERFYRTDRGQDTRRGRRRAWGSRSCEAIAEAHHGTVRESPTPRSEAARRSRWTCRSTRPTGSSDMRAGVVSRKFASGLSTTPSPPRVRAAVAPPPHRPR